MVSANIWRYVATVVDDERRRRDLSIKALADQAGVDESTVRRMLTAEPVRLASLRVVATSLGLGWPELLSALAEPTSHATVQVSGSHR